MNFFKKKYDAYSDEELMQCISLGVHAALEELYGRYKRNMHYFFFKMLNRDPIAADDFLQELFFKIIEKAGRFDGNRKFSTWIYSIAVNMCKNEYRKQNIRRQHYENTCTEDLMFENENYSTEFDRILFNCKLHEELDLLEENHRTTFILRFQEELSIREIADIMTCAQGTVKSRIFYTLKKLSEKLKMFKPQTIS